MSFRAVLALVAVGTLVGFPAHSQQRPRFIAQADSAYASGNLALADSLYFIAVRYWPRDPVARTALGRYLGEQGKAKPASILLEEARMFGGDPVEIGRHLAPLYERLGEWRALLTLPGSPLSPAERRRAAWLAENPFTVWEGGAAPMVGMPRGDTIARVGARVHGTSVVAAIVGSDIGVVVGTRLGDVAARRFDGDPTVVAVDSLSIGQTRLTNVPAAIGTDAASLILGVGALARVVQLDYARHRMVVTRSDATRADAKHPLARRAGQFMVLDGGRWVPLAEFAAAVAKLPKTLVIDIPAGEVRVRP